MTPFFELSAVMSTRDKPCRGDSFPLRDKSAVTAVMLWYWQHCDLCSEPQLLIKTHLTITPTSPVQHVLLTPLVHQNQRWYFFCAIYHIIINSVAKDWPTQICRLGAIWGLVFYMRTLCHMVWEAGIKPPALWWLIHKLKKKIKKKKNRARERTDLFCLCLHLILLLPANSGTIHFFI